MQPRNGLLRCCCANPRFSTRLDQDMNLDADALQRIVRRPGKSNGMEHERAVLASSKADTEECIPTLGINDNGNRRDLCSAFGCSSGIPSPTFSEKTAGTPSTQNPHRRDGQVLQQSHWD